MGTGDVPTGTTRLLVANWNRGRQLGDQDRRREEAAVSESPGCVGRRRASGNMDPQPLPAASGSLCPPLVPPGAQKARGRGAGDGGAGAGSLGAPQSCSFRVPPCKDSAQNWETEARTKTVHLVAFLLAGRAVSLPLSPVPNSLWLPSTFRTKPTTPGPPLFPLGSSRLPWSLVPTPGPLHLPCTPFPPSVKRSHTQVGPSGSHPKLPGHPATPRSPVGLLTVVAVISRPTSLPFPR
jgi:hypothetical protein